MDYFTYGKRLDYILDLIRKGGLRSPKDLEEKFDCSERTIRKMINHLRRDGYEIKYSRSTARYTLEEK